MGPELVLGAADRVLSIVAKLPHLLRPKERREPSLDGPRLLALRVAKERREPRELEVFPICFDVNLGSAVPQIEVTLRAVNHLSKPLVLESVRVTLHIASIRGFERLDLVMEVEIPARNSWEICCRRELADSEIRLLRESLTGGGPHYGSVHFVAVGRVRRRHIRLAVWQGMGVRGWVAGLRTAVPLAAS